MHDLLEMIAVLSGVSVVIMVLIIAFLYTPILFSVPLLLIAIWFGAMILKEFV